jgi:hypothetical protein
MRRNQIHAGQTYLTRAGGRLLEVDALVVDDGVACVLYTDQHTGRECQCTLAAFAGRVTRPLELRPFTPPPKRSNPDA